MAPLRLLLPLAVAALTPLALAACGAAPSGDAGGKPPAQNPVVRSVNGMTGSLDRARDAAAGMDQRNAEREAAAANAMR